MNRVPTCSGNTRSAGWLRALLPASESGHNRARRRVARPVHPVRRAAGVRAPSSAATGRWSGRLPAGTRPTPDAEDAFQATFLVLARKAGRSLTGSGRRLAVRGRLPGGAASPREGRPDPDLRAGGGGHDPRAPPARRPIDDWLPILDEESALPAKYRLRWCCANSRAGPGRRRPSDSGSPRARCPAGSPGAGIAPETAFETRDATAGRRTDGPAGFGGHRSGEGCPPNCLCGRPRR